jgi:hypothetical protein
MRGDIGEGADDRQVPRQFKRRLHDDALVDKYNFFIFEVVRMSRARRHIRRRYTGDGVFMVAGKVIGRRAQLRPGML